MISEGKVSVGGKIVLDPSYRVSLSHDVIRVRGELPSKKQLVYIMMNKPTGVVTTRSDEKGRPTVYEILGDVGQWVFPVGRLDQHTAGLLLFTNDNRFGEELTNPASKIPKTYLVELNTPLSARHRMSMEAGLELGDERLLPAIISNENGTSFEMTIVEGKNRQVRRMCEEFGYQVLSLTRIRFGNFELKRLKEGEWREIAKEEIMTDPIARLRGRRQVAPNSSRR